MRFVPLVTLKPVVLPVYVTEAGSRAKLPDIRLLVKCVVLGAVLVVVSLAEIVPLEALPVP